MRIDKDDMVAGVVFTSWMPGSPDIRSADVCWSAPLHVVNASIAWPIRGGATRDSDPAQIEQRSERVDALKQDFDLISEREQLRGADLSRECPSYSAASPSETDQSIRSKRATPSDRDAILSTE